MKKSLTVALFVFITAESHALDITNFKRVLLPVLSKDVLAGATYSYVTSVQAFASDSIKYYPAPTTTGAPAIGGMGADDVVMPIWWPAGDNSSHGRILFVDPDSADALSLDYSMRYFSSPSSVKAGPSSPVMLPVVREPDFKVGRTGISGITITPVYTPGRPLGYYLGYLEESYRLRIYSMDEPIAVRLKLQFTALWLTPLPPANPSPNLPTQERVVYVVSRDVQDATYPYYFDASLSDLFNLCPQLTLDPCLIGAASLTVEPLESSRRYWWFLSANYHDGRIGIRAPR